MRRWVGLAVAVALLALAASALLLVPSPHKHQRVIPWSDAVPTPVRYVPAAPKGAHACGDRDVRLSAPERSGVNSVESMYFLDVRNVSTAPCSLEGRPRIDVPRGAAGEISVADATGVVLPLPPPVPPGFPRRGARFGLAPGASAHAGIAVLGICPKRRDETNVPVHVGLPEGAKSVPLAVSACRGSSTTLAIGPFTPPDQPVPTTHHWPLTISLEAPKSVRIGQRIDYLVRLTNSSTGSFEFPPGGLCPEFDQTIAGSVDNPSDVLNCRPMGALAPGESALFAMQIDLFPYPSAGQHTLIWHLEDGTKSGMTARLGIEINL